MQKEIISIVNEVLDKHLKGDLEAAVDLNRVSEEYRDVCKKLNSLLNSERENTKVAFEKESNFRRIFLQIGNLCNQVLKGNLSQRMNTLALAFEMRPMGTVLNRVFDSLQENIEELKDKESNLKTAISSFGSVLSSASEGDLTRKVDLSEISEEYRPIGRNINGMISAIEEDIEELRSRTEVIKKSQEYTRSLFYSIPNPTSILDLDGRRIDTAKATEDLFRIPRDEILGSKVEDLYAKEDLKKIREAMESGKEGYSSCETTCIRGDGTRFPVVLSFAPVRDKDGNLINIVFSATDITELRKREEELKIAVSTFGKVLSKAASGDLSARVELDAVGVDYRQIGKSINLVIKSTGKYLQKSEETKNYLEDVRNSVSEMLYTLDTNGVTTYINPAFTKVTGFTEEDMIGVPIEKWPALPPDLRPIITEREHQRVKTGEPVINVEAELVRKNGERFPITYSASGIRDVNGKVIGEVVVATDISELRKREEETKEARAYAEAIIANISDPLWVVDKEDRWILVNDAMKKATGYGGREILGKQTLKQPLFKFFLGVPDGKERLKAMSDGIKASEHVAEIIPWVTKDNSFLMMSCSGEPLRDPEGDVIGGVFIGKEMSTLQRAGTETTKALAKKAETVVGKDYELATLLFMTNAAMLAGDSSLDILKATVDGYNKRFDKNVKIKDGLTLRNMKKEDLPSFVEFLLETFYQCIGPTTFECSEGIRTIGNIVEKVRAKHG